MQPTTFACCAISVLAISFSSVSSYAAVGYGFQVDTKGTSLPVSGDTGNYVTISNGNRYAINDLSEATGVNTPDTLTAQYIRSTNAAAISSYQWDTEQIGLGSPHNELAVIEGRIGSRTTSGDQESNILRVSYGSTPPDPFLGNLQPTATFTNQASGQRSIVSGTSYGISINYVASSGLLTYSGMSASPLTYTVTRPINDLVLRVNTNGVVPTSGTNFRSLTVSNLRISNGGGAFENLDRFLDGVTTNSLNAQATTNAGERVTGQRQFAFWEDVVSQSEDFIITADVNFLWSGTGNAPTGSQMAYQFKFGDGLSPIAIPEPSSCVLASLALIAVTLRRSR